MQETNADKQYGIMMNTPIPKLILSLSLPAVISMMITVIYNTADTYFVSKIDKSASAAVGMVYTIMAIIQAVGYGLCMGAGSLVSRMLGKKQNKKADMYASSAFFVAFLVGLVVTVFGLLFLDPVLSVLGCTKSIKPFAVPYAKYVLIAAPLSCSTFVLNNVLRASGQTAFAMFGMGIGGVLNLVIDPLLIFKLNLGTAGASIATAISQTVSFLILGFFYASRRSVVCIRLSSMSRRWADYREIILTGLPTVFRQGMGALSTALLNLQAVSFADYGDAAVAAITIAYKPYTLVRNMVLGIGQGFQPAAGYNFAAGNKKRTWSAFKFTCLLGTVLCIMFAVWFGLFPGAIIKWFNADSDVIKIGTHALRFCAAVLPVMAISTYVNVMYQCLGFKWQATLLACCRQGIFFVPIILIMPKLIGLAGVETAQPLSDLCTFAISIPFLAVFYRKNIIENK